MDKKYQALSVQFKIQKMASRCTLETLCLCIKLYTAQYF